MEQDICMICSNFLSNEEKLFHPCECDFKYCFFCFKDLFEKMSGSRQGKCPQCSKALKARISVPIQPCSFPADKSQHRNIRIISRESLYIKHIPVSLSIATLKSPPYFGKYGEIKQISIDFKYFQEDPEETYRIFIHFNTKLSAAKALIAVHDLAVGYSKLHAEYVVLNFCGNYLKGKNCFNRNCKFLHQVPEQPDWVWFKELSKVDLSQVKNLEKFEKRLADPFPEVQIFLRPTQEIVIPKRSSKYTPKYIPITGINFKSSEGLTERQDKKAACLKDLKESVLNKPTKGGVFALLSEDD